MKAVLLGEITKKKGEQDREGEESGKMPFQAGLQPQPIHHASELSG